MEEYKLEDLKCCGNCREGPFCDKRNNFLFKVCSDWTYDKFTYKEREKE